MESRSTNLLAVPSEQADRTELDTPRAGFPAALWDRVRAAQVPRLAAKVAKAAVLLTKPVWRQGLFQGVAATIEHRQLASLVKPTTVIDIGANKGQFTLFALEAWPGCTVFAFEPLPGPAACFRRVTARYPRVKLFEAAVAPSAGQRQIHLSQREDSSSLLPIDQQMSAVFPEARAAGQSATINAAPLEHFIQYQDMAGSCLLKIDVQGFEQDCLKGCESLFKYIDHIYVECSYVELYTGQALIHDIIKLMASHSFEFIGESNTISRPNLGKIQSDCLFTRRAA